MQATEPERVQELETAISLRKKEIEELEKQKELFQSQAHGLGPKSKRDLLLASFPVLEDYVECAKKSIQDVPVEQVVHVLSQLNIADREIIKQNSNDTVELKGLQRALQKQQNKYNLLFSKFQELSEYMSLKRIPLSRQRQYKNIPPLEELKARKKVVRQEIQAGTVARERKGSAISKLSAMIENSRSVVDEIDELYNQLRVVNCDAAVEMKLIERLSTEVEDASSFLDQKRQAMDSVSCLLIKQGAIKLKAEKNDVASSQRIPQERVVKAQDYRLAQLEKRLKAVEKTLQSNYLKPEVDRILISKWSSNTIDVSEDPKDLYDIEQIIPTQEKIHPGVYNLFLSEKEKVSRTVSLLNIGTKEKEEVIASLVCKLEALCREFNMVIEELDELTVNANHIEEGERTQALAFVQEQRAYIYTLMCEKKKCLSGSTRR